MAKIDPYIIFTGNCEAAFNHYRSVFGTEFSMFSRYSDMPSQEGRGLPRLLWVTISPSPLQLIPKLRPTTFLLACRKEEE